MSVPCLLDTQLMVLLVVGITARPIIRKHRNLTEFDEDDFDLLVMLLGEDPKLVLLPNTVTETANLLRQHKDPERRRIMASFHALIARNRERYVPSRAAAGRSEYEKLGITDSAIIVCCARRYKLLTGDLDLYNAAQSVGVDATNFNHHREDFGLI